MSTRKLLLLLLPVMIVSMAGYTWIGLRVDDPAPIVTQVITIAPAADIVSERRPRPEPAASTKDVSPISKEKPDATAAVRLAGRIVDANGQGIAGIQVRLRTLRQTESRFILRQAVTAANGGFVLDDLEPHSTYTLFTRAIADYPGYRLKAFTLQSLPAPFEIRLARLDLVDIEGTVVDAEHAPVANFMLTIDSLDTNYPARTVTTDESGYFRLEAFPEGGLKFYTATPEYFRITGHRATSGEYRNLALVIDRGDYSIAGRIVDESGMPVAPARVTLKSVITDRELRSSATRTRLTDASGHFVFTDLGGIEHVLGIYASGYSPHILRHEFQSYSDHLEIRLSH